MEGTMDSPRWKKLFRDLQAAQGRIGMMVVAIAVSIFGVGTILGAYTILTREISRNYLGTNPASALLELDQVDDAVVEAVRQQPGIADAEASSSVQARVEVSPNEWMPILLFVIKDYDAMRLNTFKPEEGAWPPPDQTILLEREALKLVKGKIGDTMNIQTPNGAKQTVTVSGTVHDPGLAPAWQEQALYGYITPSTLAWLGESDTLHILKVTVKNQPGDIAAIDSTLSKLAVWLEGQGFKVEEIRIPPPLKHPHQSQMTSILTMLIAFSFMALVLSGILTAAMIGGLLAQQIRQIGIMKAIGARSSQITSLYLVLIVLIGIAAIAIGVPPGIAVARAFARMVGQLLNFTLYSEAIPGWVFVVQILMGILVPLLVTLNPILRTARTTVRETLNDYGTTRESFGSRGLDGWLSKIRGVDNTLILALRNTFRRRGRLLLTLGLLSAAGGMFMTGINTKTGWERYITDAALDRHYDLEVRFNSPQPEQMIYSIITNSPGVQTVEIWNYTPAALYRPDGLNIVRTYPDGGHGSFTLRSTPLESDLMGLPILAGRWLEAHDIDAITLNQNAKALFPNAKVGDMIRLTVEGRPATFRLVGIIRQVLTPAAAYVTPKGYAAATDEPLQSITAVRVVMNEHDAATVNSASGQIENALAAENVSLRILLSENMLEGATSGHVYIFIASLILMSAVMAVVGALGLASSMGTSVIERTREFGIMRAIGARSRTILRNVISEGVFIGLMSWILAVVLSIPLSLGVGYLIGNLAFNAPLPLILSPLGLGLWLVIIVIGSIAASAYPAQKASSLTIRETLAYV
jgi:putative ABC transport system permease protein